MVRLLFNHKVISHQICPHPQRREDASLLRVRELTWPSRISETPPSRSHWRKTIQVPTVQLLKCSLLWTQTTHDQTPNKWLISSSDMTTAQIFKIECPLFLMNKDANALLLLGVNKKTNFVKFADSAVGWRYLWLVTCGTSIWGSHCWVWKWELRSAMMQTKYFEK